MKDNKNREYAKLNDLKHGDTVTVDGDFDSIKPWSEHTVQAGDDGFYILEDDGTRFFLDGQLEEGYLIGIYKGSISA